MKVKLVATKKLKEAREKENLKQEDMAALIAIIFGRKVSPSMYQKIEQGRYGVDHTDAVLISKMLRVGIKDLWIRQQ